MQGPLLFCPVLFFFACVLEPPSAALNSVPLFFLFQNVEKQRGDVSKEKYSGDDEIDSIQLRSYTFATLKL